MTNLLEVIKANGVFFIGYLIVVISQYIFVPIIEVLTDIGWIFDDIATILWLAIFMIWILALLIIPNYFVIKAISFKETHNNRLGNITQSVLFIGFGITFTIIAYYIFPALADMLEYTWLVSLYWISIILHWALSVIVAPINKIIANKY